MEENTAGTQTVDNSSQQPAGNTQQPERIFTQAEVNRIVQERLARARQDTETTDTYRHERDEARRELEQYKNSAFLKEKGVKADDMDYVTFKAQQMVGDGTDFQQAAEKFLKDNPRFTSAGTYRVSTSTSSNSNGSCGSILSGADDPTAIRKAMGLKG